MPLVTAPSTPRRPDAAAGYEVDATEVLFPEPDRRRPFELGLVAGVVAVALGLVVVGYRQDSRQSLDELTAPTAQIVVDTQPRPVPTTVADAAPASSAAPIVLDFSGVDLTGNGTVAPPSLGDEFEPRGPVATEPPATTTSAAPPTTEALVEPEVAAEQPAETGAEDLSDDAGPLADALPAPTATTRHVPPVLFGDNAVDGPVIGTVTIEGQVATDRQAAELVELVEGVFGAELVVNNSAVGPAGQTGAVANIRISDAALFTTKRGSIDSSVLPMLERIVVLLRLAPNATMTVVGHTDSVGVPEENIDLSRRRAESVINYLEFRSISADRLRAEGVGSNYPIASDDTEEGRNANRRIEIVIEGVRPA